MLSIYWTVVYENRINAMEILVKLTGKAPSWCLSGWISRQQFEETWMSLLGVLNPLPSDTTQTPPSHEVLCLTLLLSISVSVATFVGKIFLFISASCCVAGFQY